MDDTARTGELRRKLEKDPGSRLFAQLAEELRKEGKHDEAISVARKGLEKNPNYPSARLTLARALLDSGRTQEARPELEQIVKASPDNIMASRLLGDALEQLGEPALALAQFERTLRLSPGDKVVIEKIADLKAKAAAPAPLSPAPSVATLQAPVIAISPQAPLPSVFGDEPPPAVTLAPVVPAPVLPGAPAPPAAVSQPTPSQAPLALDRDLASGTFSPGALNAADIQKHFDETAAADSAPAHAPSTLPATLPPAAPEIVAAPPADAFPSVELPAEDPGGATLPLTSMTLADLYLQQGLKAEASAVLSQVLKEEPENSQARSKLAAVSGDLAALPPADGLPLAESKAPKTRREVRERIVLDLKSFAGAVEREALAQRATERGVL